ncbi:glycosyltransferase family 4 protein [Anaeromyxobacter sp. SG26]|uniref:glycosyltransferase family 4 protein n=1 Tax=Anaeromyxobacter sp. SG26 TaxID=2925407 RepID=UPI001F5699D4|nr:glycosyltransferase family 4 protein [Anaeromyxobacter sp. SG26]
MDRPDPSLSIAYTNYGEQSGVTLHVAHALRALGHRITPVSARGPLDLRDPATRLPRFTRDVAVHLALATARFRSQALTYRWNTPYAFDVHSRHLGVALAALDPAPDVVLQNGALFSPGLPARLPYVLLLDHTRALAEAAPAFRRAGLAAPPRYGRAWFERERACYRGAAAIATFSENVARSLVRDYGLARERIVVVGAGANVVPERPARADDGETILFVGREFARKGGTILLDAFERVRRRRPAARLLIAGPPEPLALPDGAEQLGPVPYDGLEELFSRATVFALPTLVEPFGIAFLDAMACGVPCVGTAVEAVPEIIEEGKTGLLVPPGDPSALAEVLLALLGDPARARELGVAGRARVLKRFQWTQVGARLDAVLQPARAAAREPARAAS